MGRVAGTVPFRHWGQALHILGGLQIRATFWQTFLSQRWLPSQRLVGFWSPCLCRDVKLKGTPEGRAFALQPPAVAMTRGKQGEGIEGPGLGD